MQSFDDSDVGCTQVGFTDTTAGNTIQFQGFEILPGAICTVTYRVEVTGDAPIGSEIENMATVTFASTVGGPTFSPAFDTNVSEVERASITKTYVNGSSSSDGTADPNLVPGESAEFALSVCVPEGRVDNFLLRDRDNSFGINASNDFFAPIAAGDITLSLIHI